MLNVITASLPCIIPLVVFPKALFSGCLCSRPSTVHHVRYPSQYSISSLSFDHHLYADNTQIVFSLHPLNFDLSISHLQKGSSTDLFLEAASQLVTWPTRHTVNSSKSQLVTVNSSHDQLVTTSDLLWPNYISLQYLLLSHLLTLLYPALPRFVNCLYHCYLYRSLLTRLL